MVVDLKAVHEWFLQRGLPLVLTPRVRSKSLITRSAPMVSGIGAVIALTMMLAELTGGDPDYHNALYLLHRAGTRLSEAADGRQRWW